MKFYNTALSILLYSIMIILMIMGIVFALEGHFARASWHGILVLLMYRVLDNIEKEE